MWDFMLLPSFEVCCVGEVEDARKGSGGDGMGGEEPVEIFWRTLGVRGMGIEFWGLRRREDGAEEIKFDEGVEGGSGGLVGIEDGDELCG